MSELVEAVQKTVRREVAQVLRQAADTIDGDGQAVARRRLSDAEFAERREIARAAERKVRRGRPRGAGFRHQQVLDLLERHPEGLGGRQIGARCGMKGTQVYGVLKRLQRDGEVEKRGANGYVVV